MSQYDWLCDVCRCMMSPILSIHWIDLGFINNYKEPQLWLILLKYSADMASAFPWIITIPQGITEQNLTKFFLSCQRLFHLFLRPLYMPPTSFRAKTLKLYSSQNSWPVGPRAIIEQNLTEFFIFLQKVFPFISRTTIYAIYKFSCKNARIVFWSKFLTSGT